MDGDVQARGVSVPMDLGFDDVLDNLDLTVQVSLDGNQGSWGVIGDLIYMDLSDEEGTQVGTVKGEVEQWLHRVPVRLPPARCWPHRLSCSRQPVSRQEWPGR